MIVTELVEMYEEGVITAYQAAMDCLHMLDPVDPGVVLSGLPCKIVDEMLEYARRYDPSRIQSRRRPFPAGDQVRSAQNWIESRRKSAEFQAEGPSEQLRFGLPSTTDLHGSVSD
jgi:hypothetical protein